MKNTLVLSHYTGWLMGIRVVGYNNLPINQYIIYVCMYDYVYM